MSPSATRAPRALLVSALAALSLGCGASVATPSDDAATPDTTPVDSGLRLDTGARTDTGARIDTGTRTDTGARTDTGTRTDTGPRSDTGARTDAADPDAGAASDDAPDAARDSGVDAWDAPPSVEIASPCRPLAPDGTPQPTLAATGCFADPQATRPAAGVIPFEVTAPLWSDGTLKRRFVYVPRTRSVHLAGPDALGLPEGTVLIKEFAIERTRGDAATRRPVETRFFVRRAGAWMPFSYRWNAAGDDAALLSDAGARETYAVTDPATPGAPRTYTHVFPSRSDCLHCHNGAAGFVLGFTGRQLDRDVARDGATTNQLRALAASDLFDAPLPAAPATGTRLVDPADATQPLGARARSWLHANCAHCHRPDGPVWRCYVRLRYEDIAGAAACTDHGIVPGSPEASRVFVRLATRGRERMPPVGTDLVDEASTEMLRAWITGLRAGECATP